MSLAVNPLVVSAAQKRLAGAGGKNRPAGDAVAKGNVEG